MLGVWKLVLSLRDRFFSPSPRRKCRKFCPSEQGHVYLRDSCLTLVPPQGGWQCPNGLGILIQLSLSSYLAQFLGIKRFLAPKHVAWLWGFFTGCLNGNQFQDPVGNPQKGCPGNLCETVVGVSTPFGKDACSSKWVIFFPFLKGENKTIFELPPPQS